MTIDDIIAHMIAADEDDQVSRAHAREIARIAAWNVAQREAAWMTARETPPTSTPLSLPPPGWGGVIVED